MPASGGAVRRGPYECDPLVRPLSGGGRDRREADGRSKLEPRSAKPRREACGGGDRHSHRVEVHAALILQTIEERPQVYLREVRDTLQEHGAAVSLSGLSRFFRRHGITRKKGRFTRPSRTVRT